VKTDVETLNPTRVKMTVEVPFAELQPSLDAAYRRIGGQITIPGFRKGKVPPRVIDQRVGRGAVLEEAINEALPKLYGQAVEDSDLAAVGQPEVDITSLEDGEQLVFTAEVDVRPEFELPAYDGIAVTVDDVAVTDDEVDEAIKGLGERFATLTGVEREAADGDFVSMDLSATVGGEALDDLSAKGLSYQVGSGAMLDGLDEALLGMSAGESKDFTTALVGGDHAGEDATVTVTLTSVKERELPALDDDFAQLASEFDTIEELRTDARTRLERIKRMEQGVQARDKVLESLLEKVDMPLPEKLVEDEVKARMHDLDHQLERAQLSKEEFLAAEGKTAEELDAEADKQIRDGLKAQFVLDKIVEAEQISLDQNELTNHLVRSAARYGMAPEQFAQQVVQAGQIPALVSEVVRGKALALVLERAEVTDSSGNPVDLEDLREDVPQMMSELDDVEPAETADADTADAEPADAEPADAEPADAETTDTEAAPSEQ
jgi:trigger factor